MGASCGLMQNEDIIQQHRQLERHYQSCGLMQNEDIIQQFRKDKEKKQVVV